MSILKRVTSDMRCLCSSTLLRCSASFRLSRDSRCSVLLTVRSLKVLICQTSGQDEQTAMQPRACDQLQQLVVEGEFFTIAILSFSCRTGGR